MATQRKAGTSLNDERQRKLDEMLAAAPFATRSSLIARAVDVMYAVWRQTGRDINTVIGMNGLTGHTAGGAA